MATADFKIVVNTNVDGVILIKSQTEEALDFLLDELEYGCLPNGDVAMASGDVEAFVLEAEDKQLWAEIV